MLKLKARFVCSYKEKQKLNLFLIQKKRVLKPLKDFHEQQMITQVDYYLFEKYKKHNIFQILHFAENQTIRFLNNLNHRY
ncbi:hypothetical protein D3C85_1795240 [compost metagenome]